MIVEYPLAFNAIKLIAVMSRITAFVMAFPYFSSQHISPRMKVGFILFVAIVLFPILPNSWNLSSEFMKNLDMVKLLVLILTEVLLGLAIVLFVMLLFAVFSFAGEVISRDVGLVMAQMVDPSLNESNSMVSHILLQTFFILFLIMDGHHEVIRVAAASFETLPPGSFMINGEMTEACIRLSSQMLVMGFKIAFPIFAVMLFVNVGLGLMARVGEDFPVLMLSFSLRLGLGLVMLIALFPIFFSIARGIQTQIFEWLAYLVNLEM